MNLSKSYEFFAPESVTERIHIVGCGSVGSTIAENLVRCGLTKLTLWDFDTVEEKNIVNQMFTSKDVGKKKAEALRDILLDINPEAKDDIQIKTDGWKGKSLSGYIFLAVDNIAIRQQIVKEHFENPFVKAVFDVRTVLESAQHYAADWGDRAMKENLLKSMQFTEEEAAEETPTSACGTILGVATTVRLISAYAVNNFLNFVKGRGIKKVILSDAFTFETQAY